MRPPDDSAAASAAPNSPTAVEAALPPTVQNSAALEKVNSQDAAMHAHPPDTQDEKDPEKKDESAPSVEGATVDAAAADAEQEYPTVWKLVLLSVALCLAMFLVSLVSCCNFPCHWPLISFSYLFVLHLNLLTSFSRMVLFSPPQFPVSPMNSALLPMLLGMGALTSSPFAACS